MKLKESSMKKKKKKKKMESHTLQFPLNSNILGKNYASHAL